MSFEMRGQGGSQECTSHQTYGRERIKCQQWLRLSWLSFVRGRGSTWRSKVKQDNERISKKLMTNNKCFECEWNSRSVKKLFAEKPQEWFIDRLEGIADSIKILLCKDALSKKKKKRGGGQARNTHAIFSMTKIYERKLEGMIQPPCLYAFCKNYP